MYVFKSYIGCCWGTGICNLGCMNALKVSRLYPRCPDHFDITYKVLCVVQLFTFSKRDHVVVCLDCFNKIQKPSGLKNRNFFISLEARSPWSRCWQIWFLVRAFFLACRLSHYVLTRHFLECMQRESPLVFPYKKIINSIGSEPPHPAHDLF